MPNSSCPKSLSQIVPVSKSHTFSRSARRPRKAPHRAAELPREIISLTTYAELELYLTKFVAGDLGLVLLLGRHGTGKSESVRRVFAMPHDGRTVTDNDAPHVLHVEGHMQPFGLYRHLWEYRDRPVVLDDLDRLYADPDCVRLLKPLCNTVPRKRLQWLTSVTLNDESIPSSFTTTSSVILIANEWRSLNPNVRALEDRAIILHFNPSNAEVHRKVGEWFDDTEVYAFLAGLMPMIPFVSMRHYCKGSQLRRAGLPDWQASLVQMAIANSRLASVFAVRVDPTLQSERERVDRFMTLTGCSRATYFRLKSRLPNSTSHEPIQARTGTV